MGRPTRERVNSVAVSIMEDHISSKRSALLEGGRRRLSELIVSTRVDDGTFPGGRIRWGIYLSRKVNFKFDWKHKRDEFSCGQSCASLTVQLGSPDFCPRHPCHWTRHENS